MRLIEWLCLEKEIKILPVRFVRVTLCVAFCMFYENEI